MNHIDRRRIEAQARFDRLWKTDPHYFDPQRNVMERERIHRSFDLLKSKVVLDPCKIADLGCGKGDFAHLLADQGASVDAVDISGVALKLLKEKGGRTIATFQEYLPSTTLQDNAYDAVVCLDLIAFLPEDEYRLLFSEMARLIKNDGHALGSSPLDIHSEDALQRYSALVETEFHVEEWVLSYHRLWIRFKEILDAPAHFARAGSDPEYRNRALKERSGFGKSWFRWNSYPLVAKIWGGFAWILSPLTHTIRNSRAFLLSSEKICKFLWSQEGISHAIFIGKRRPLFIHLPEKEVPKEHKQKRQVWE